MQYRQRTAPTEIVLEYLYNTLSGITEDRIMEFLRIEREEEQVVPEKHLSVLVVRAIYN